MSGYYQGAAPNVLQTTLVSTDKQGGNSVGSNYFVYSNSLLYAILIDIFLLTDNTNDSSNLNLNIIKGEY